MTLEFLGNSHFCQAGSMAVDPISQPKKHMTGSNKRTDVFTMAGSRYDKSDPLPSCQLPKLNFLKFQIFVHDDNTIKKYTPQN